MMEEKMTEKRLVPHVQGGQTNADQVWTHLSAYQQREILQRIIQACQMLMKEESQAREVAHECLD